MYDLYSKHKRENRIKSSKYNTININKEKNDFINYNQDIFKTLNKFNTNNKEKNRLYSSHGYRTVYIDDKIKLLPKNHEQSLKKHQLINKLDEQLAMFKDITEKSSNFNNIDLSKNMLDENLKIHPYIKSKTNTVLNMTKNNQNVNASKSIFKSNLNTTKKNLSSVDLLLKHIYSEEKSEKYIQDNKKDLSKKKEIRSKIYNLLKSKECVPLCQDFMSKIEGFNLKLLNSLQSDINLSKEKRKCSNFHFSNTYKQEREKELFTNTKMIKEERIPLEIVLRKNFTRKELDIIKYDVDFFNKNNKLLNCIKFLKPKSLINKISEEEEKRELRKRQLELKQKNFKSLRAFTILKKFLTHKLIIPYLEKKKNSLSDLSKYNTTESANEIKLSEIKQNINKKLNHINNITINEENKHDFNEKYVDTILIDMNKRLNENKRNSFFEADKVLLMNKFGNLKPKSGKTRPGSNTKSIIENIISTEAFTSRNVNRPYSRSERDVFFQESKDDKSKDSFSDYQKTIINTNKRKMYDKKNMIDKVILHNKLTKNKKNEIQENE